MQTLFLSLYKGFSSILTERLPAASSAQTLQDLKSINPAGANAMDLEEPSAMEMEMDNEDSKPEKRCSRQYYNDPISFCQNPSMIVQNMKSQCFLYFAVI